MLGPARALSCHVVAGTVLTAQYAVAMLGPDSECSNQEA